jgi:hypothetical protein
MNDRITWHGLTSPPHVQEGAHIVLIAGKGGLESLAAARIDPFGLIPEVSSRRLIKSTICPVKQFPLVVFSSLAFLAGLLQPKRVGFLVQALLVLDAAPCFLFVVLGREVVDL